MCKLVYTAYSYYLSVWCGLFAAESGWGENITG